MKLPLTRPTQKIVKLFESDSVQQDDVKSPSSQSQSATKTTENTSEVKLLSTESNIDKSLDHPTTSSKQEPTSSVDVPEGSDDCKSKTVFVFSMDNVPSGCYYLTHPNKYVFPGSTHTWYGSGNPEKDREEIFEEEDQDDDEFVIGYDDDDEDDDDDDDEEVEDCDEDKCETESSTNLGENSDSNDVVDDAAAALKASDSVLLGKRVGSTENVESVSPLKQQKTNDE